MKGKHDETRKQNYLPCVGVRKENDICKTKKSKISLSDFCRYATLGKEIRHVEGLEKCSYELNKIGNNINQIAVLCHQRAVQNPSLDEIRKQLCKVTERIYDVLGGDEDGDSQAD